MSECPFNGEPCGCEKCVKVKVGMGEVNCCGDCWWKNLGGFVLMPLVEILNHNLEKLNEMSQPSEKCKVCGSSFEEIVAVGKMGCAACYDSHREAVYANIAYLQSSNTRHKGKKPERFTLEEKIAQAVKEERYEDAAKLRDRLKELSQNIF